MGDEDSPVGEPINPCLLCLTLVLGEQFSEVAGRAGGQDLEV